MCKDCKRATFGGDYTGTANRTISGLACQRWDAQTPHSHTFTDPKAYPDTTLEDAANYCRNPAPSDGVGLWCFTMDSGTRWEVCEEVPDCPRRFQ